MESPLVEFSHEVLNHNFMSFTESSDAFLLFFNECFQAGKVSFVEGLECVKLLLESRSGLVSGFGESLSGPREFKNNLVDDVLLEDSFFTVSDPGFSHGSPLCKELMSLSEESLSSLPPHSPLFDGLRVMGMLAGLVVANNMVGSVLLGVFVSMSMSSMVLLVVHWLFGHMMFGIGLPDGASDLGGELFASEDNSHCFPNLVFKESVSDLMGVGLNLLHVVAR